ncbi:MAG: DUF1571 domain-containing protein [Pirellulales bacterium]|nr:DUF1571 domain-containing protein [Pirellulales bacterium]
MVLAAAVVAVLAAGVLLRSANHRVPKAMIPATGPPGAPTADRGAGPSAAHPLVGVLEFARRVQANIQEQIRDYTAVVLKQERILGKLGPLEVCFVKIRERPFSAYMKFLAPQGLKGQEALYVAGANDGKMFAHAGSGIRALVGTVQIPPTGPIAMLGQRYPMTELGIANLTRRLIEVGDHDKQYGECYVWMDEDAKVGNRPCTSITVMHPFKRPAFIYYIARIFVDREWMVPIHYEAYEWPDTPGGPPVLLERYTYTHLKLNPGLTDVDFDPHNPQYNFRLK